VSPHERLLKHLTEGGPDAQDEAHAARCAACAALLSREGQPMAALAPQEAWLEAAHRELARPRVPWWLLALGLSAANALLVTTAVFVLEAWNWEASTSPRWLFLGAATVLAALATTGALLALSPSRRWLEVSIGLAAVAPLGVLLAADGRVASGPFLAGASCLWTVLLLASLPLAGGLWLLTRMAYSTWRALAVGLVSGSVGLLALQFHCANGASSHLLVFHLLPWVALGGAAVFLRSRLPTSSFAR